MTWTSTRLKYLATEPIVNGLGEAARDGDDSWPRYVRTTDIASPTSLNPVKRVTLPPELAVAAQLKRNDLLLCAAGSLGKTYLHLSDEPGCYAGYLVRFRPNTLVADPRFISYWSQSQPFVDQVALGAVKSTIDNFSAGKYRNMTLRLPPLRDQQRISDFLDRQVFLLDQAIMLRGHQAKFFVLRTQEAIRVAVAGGGSSVGPPEAPWVAKLHDKAYLQPLSRTLTLQRGVDLTDIERVSGIYSVYTTAGKNGSHNRCIVEDPGVVIGRYGSVGSVFWATEAHWPHNTTLYVRDYKNNYRRYVYYLLKSYPYDRLQARSAIPGINRNDMAVDLMPWLPPELQSSAIDACEEAEQIEIQARSALRVAMLLLQERKQALITAAVTGQLDVTTARSGLGVDVP